MDTNGKQNDLLKSANADIDKDSNSVKQQFYEATKTKIATTTTMARAATESAASSLSAAPEEDLNDVAFDSDSNETLISKTLNTTRRLRKRKHRKFLVTQDLQSELKDCNIEDVVALEHKIREIAYQNSLTHDEMMKILRKFVTNEHILALVTLKAEDEMAREISETKPAAILITDTPTVPKLTRSKARAMKCNPLMPLGRSKLSSVTSLPEIRSLIEDDLCSDEDDEEFIVHDEDLLSDDDGTAVTASDLESCPHSPQTPATPMPLETEITLACTKATTSIAATPLTRQDSTSDITTNTADDCFKVPFDKHLKNVSAEEEDLRIATRTRSKLCLEQTTIEDLQSEFIPPDVEDYMQIDDIQSTGIDDEWLQFLNDFNKPLVNTQSVDDDDPVNDPEYVAADLESGK